MPQVKKEKKQSSKKSIKSEKAEKMSTPKEKLGGGRGRLLTGIVVSDKPEKTVVVLVTRYKEHPKYKKRYKVSKKYYAHDEKNQYRKGDKVIIQECRPLSKKKRWVVKSKVE